MTLLLAIGCAVIAWGAAAQPTPGAVREIRMVPWSYLPSQSMEVSEQNPHPRQALRILIREWEGLHPGVRIKLINMPQEQAAYVTWVQTQARGGTIPEIIFYWPDANLLAQSGWLVPIDSYYEQPNKYVPENTRWRDLIHPVCIEPPFKMMDDHYYFVPVDIFLSAMAYNAEIFAKAGVDDPPRDWEEFMDDLARIQEAGYEPFWGMALWSNWPRDLIAWYFHDEETFRKLDVLPADGKLSIEEGNRGLKRGIVSVDSPQFREYLRLMKRWSRYWKRGFSLSKSPDTVSLFRQGRLGISWESATSVTAMADDPFITFRSGVMWFPAMTRETSPAATGRTPPLMAIPGNCFYITESARRKGLVDLCVDWLMFLTTPRNVERLTQEKTAVKLPPSVVGAKVDPVLEPLLQYGYAVGSVVPIPWGSNPEGIDNFDRLFELFLLDKLTLEETVERMKEWERRSLDEAIRLNQLLPNKRDRWDLSRW